MRTGLLLVLLLVPLAGGSTLLAQQPGSPQTELPEFLARHRDALRPLEKIYDELANENLPLENERGQSVLRRNLEDQQKSLHELLATIDSLTSAPEDLVLATQLCLQTEALTDDLFDLSQAAYDSDREELGNRLSDIETVVDRHAAWIDSYLLKLAADRQARLSELEKENAELKKKVGELSKSKAPEPH
ncbi:MAG: hypothetical protein LAN62_03280 [Acidobacteriia bacterium]|nr:hypothetical protein [Terriglobia bacterium]